MEIKLLKNRKQVISKENNQDRILWDEDNKKENDSERR